MSKRIARRHEASLACNQVTAYLKCRQWGCRPLGFSPEMINIVEADTILHVEGSTEIGDVCEPMNRPPGSLAKGMHSKGIARNLGGSFTLRKFFFLSKGKQGRTPKLL